MIYDTETIKEIVRIQRIKKNKRYFYSNRNGNVINIFTNVEGHSKFRL